MMEDSTNTQEQQLDEDSSLLFSPNTKLLTSMFSPTTGTIFKDLEDASKVLDSTVKEALQESPTDQMNISLNASRTFEDEDDDLSEELEALDQSAQALREELGSATKLSRNLSFISMEDDDEDHFLFVFGSNNNNDHSMEDLLHLTPIRSNQNTPPPGSRRQHNDDDDYDHDDKYSPLSPFEQHSRLGLSFETTGLLQQSERLIQEIGVLDATASSCVSQLANNSRATSSSPFSSPDHQRPSNAAKQKKRVRILEELNRNLSPPVSLEHKSSSKKVWLDKPSPIETVAPSTPQDILQRFPKHNGISRDNEKSPQEVQPNEISFEEEEEETVENTVLKPAKPQQLGGGDGKSTNTNTTTKPNTMSTPSSEYYFKTKKGGSHKTKCWKALPRFIRKQADAMKAKSCKRNTNSNTDMHTPSSAIMTDTTASSSSSSKQTVPINSIVNNKQGEPKLVPPILSPINSQEKPTDEEINRRICVKKLLKMLDRSTRKNKHLKRRQNKLLQLLKNAWNDKLAAQRQHKQEILDVSEIMQQTLDQSEQKSQDLARQNEQLQMELDTWKYQFEMFKDQGVQEMEEWKNQHQAQTMAKYEVQLEKEAQERVAKHLQDHQELSVLKGQLGEKQVQTHYPLLSLRKTALSFTVEPLQQQHEHTGGKEEGQQQKVVVTGDYVSHNSFATRIVQSRSNHENAQSKQQDPSSEQALLERCRKEVQDEVQALKDSHAVHVQELQLLLLAAGSSSKNSTPMTTTQRITGRALRRKEDNNKYRNQQQFGMQKKNHNKGQFQGFPVVLNKENGSIHFANLR